MRLAWGNRVNEHFRLRVVAIAQMLGCDPSWLMAVMFFETGGTFDPAKRNPVSGATGLIQFMPSTARRLGTTTDQLALMSQLEQLDYVEKYFLEFRHRLTSLADTYMAVLWPRAVGKEGAYSIFARGSAAYRDNAALDVDGDGKVTKDEATAFVAQRLEQGLRTENSAEVDADLTQPGVPIRDEGTPADEAHVQHIEQSEAPQMAPLLGLAATIFGAFAPALQALITAKLGKVTGAPDAASQTATALTQQLSQMILDAAKKQTGQTSELQAAAIVEADAQAMKEGKPGAGAIATAVAEDVASRLDAIAPYVRDVAKMEQEIFDANEMSRNAAAERAKTDTVDLGYPIATYVLIMFGVIAASLVALLGIQIYYDPNHEPDGTILTNLGIVIGVIVAKFGTIVDYRFGSSRGSAAKDILLNEINRDNANPATAVGNPRKVTMTTTASK